MQYYNKMVSSENNDGYILFIVLLFLQLFSLISLGIMMHASTIMKSNAHASQWMTLKLKAQTFLRELSAKDMLVINCMIPVTSPITLTSESLIWWQSFACKKHQSGRTFYYVMESLGRDVCAKMSESQVANYYRITLFVMLDKLQSIKYFIQASLAYPEKIRDSCQDKRHHVKSGLQMWREI